MQIVQHEVGDWQSGLERALRHVDRGYGARPSLHDRKNPALQGA